MKKLLLIPVLFALMSLGCDKLKKADDAMESVGDMNNKMSRTNSAIHKQTLLVAINELAKREKYEKLYPVPTELLAPAKGFAEEAEATELIEFTYAMLKDVNEVVPMKEFGSNCVLDEDVTAEIKDLEEKVATDSQSLSLQDKRYLRNIKKLPKKQIAKTCPENYHQDKTEPFVEMDHSLEKMNEIRLRKLGALYSLMTIAGFTPDGTVQQIINNEIYGSGRYEITAHQFLMMRVVFVRDVFLTNSLLATDLKNSGEILKATDYMLMVEKILRLSFAEDISLKLSVSVDGFKDPVIEVDENLAGANLKKTASMWKTILDRATNGVKLYKKAKTGDSGADDQMAKAESDKAQAAINQVFTYGKAWFSDLQYP